MRGKARNAASYYLACFLLNPACIIVFRLHDVLGFDSSLVINVLIHISSLKLNNQVFRSIMHEYASGLTTTPKAQLLCNLQTQETV